MGSTECREEGAGSPGSPVIRLCRLAGSSTPMAFEQTSIAARTYSRPHTWMTSSSHSFVTRALQGWLSSSQSPRSWNTNLQDILVGQLLGDSASDRTGLGCFPSAQSAFYIPWELFEPGCKVPAPPPIRPPTVLPLGS